MKKRLKDMKIDTKLQSKEAVMCAREQVCAGRVRNLAITMLRCLQDCLDLSGALTNY